MSILKKKKAKDRVPVPLAQRQERATSRVRSLVQQMVQQLVQQHKQLVGLVYKNRNKLTPQQVYDALDKDAAELATISQDLVTFVNTAAGETLIDTTDLPELTLNEDGTVTVVEA